MGHVNPSNSGMPNLVPEEELVVLAMQDDSFREVWYSLAGSLNRMPVDERLSIMNASKEIMSGVAVLMNTHGPSGTMIALTVISELLRRTTEVAQANPEKMFSFAHLPSAFYRIIRDQAVADLQKED